MALPELTLTDREIYEALALRIDGKISSNRAQKVLQKSNALNLGKTLFREQVDFITDSSKRKAAICSRRSGKSFAAGRYLIKEALEDAGTTCVYIARTREAAKRILWSSLKEANQQFRLNIRFNNADLIAVFPNQSKIMFTFFPCPYLAKRITIITWSISKTIRYSRIFLLIHPINNRFIQI